MIELERLLLWLCLLLSASTIWLGVREIGRADAYVDAGIEIARRGAEAAEICLLMAERVDSIRRLQARAVFGYTGP